MTTSYAVSCVAVLVLGECCGLCGGEANLSASAGEPERARPVTFQRAGDPGFGRCHDSNSCELTCTPPTKTRLRFTGRLRADPPYYRLEVDSYCRIE